ncbi:MAG TPA: MMPL family transporter [Chitinophagaceae bacterium]|nr:MMPL family transporter [Chitinophagaceae bacterium]
MWKSIARFVLKNKLVLLIILAAITAFMGWHASRVQLSYEFTRAIPTDNAKYVSYQNFRKLFGEDGNMMVIGIQSDKLFDEAVFNDLAQLSRQLKNIKGVENVLSIPAAVTLVKDSVSEKLGAANIFMPASQDTAAAHFLHFDSSRSLFFGLPFYKNVLYNPQTNATLMAVRINGALLITKERTVVIKQITDAGNAFGQRHSIDMHYSGLPLIRTQVADRMKVEMKWFLIGSIVLSAIILLVFFRSISTMLLSLAVVLIGVVWSVGTLDLFHYKISLLTVLIPPLIVVIGIPNCIYFLNKYHVSFAETGEKETALVNMISKMGIVTLFCNIAAAIGFAVFALTKSAILKEFGEVAGINIIALFFISFILIPAVLSYLPPPKERHTRYLNNRWLLSLLDKLEVWSLRHRPLIYTATIIILAVAVAGIFRLRSEGFIVDDLPKTDKIYTDLKFFEKNFKGVMPLEIIIDTKQKNGLRKNPLQTFAAIDSLSQYIASLPETGKPLSIVEGLKFARQAYYDGDSSNYGLPNSFDISFLSSYLTAKPDTSGGKKANDISKLLASFMDSSKQKARISVNMADVGSKRLPILLQEIEAKAHQYFDAEHYSIELTGTSVTFLEGSSFIIKGLKDSILWAFGLIALCMLYLFRSVRILFCSLLPNVIPLVITAGIMGWVGIALKPSTVLIFSIALGIAIDITIRFLVNYKQEQRESNRSQQELVVATIHSTGISIVYTSLVLIAGFIIFCFSGFGGTQALGWLTSLTLVVATFTNLILLPALLISLIPNKQK